MTQTSEAADTRARLSEAVKCINIEVHDSLAGIDEAKRYGLKGSPLHEWYYTSYLEEQEAALMHMSHAHGVFTQEGCRYRSSTLSCICRRHVHIGSFQIRLAWDRSAGAWIA